MKAVPTEAIRVLLVILNLFLSIWKLTWYNIDTQNGIKWPYLKRDTCYIATSILLWILWFQHVQTSHTPQTQWNGIFTTFSRSASKKNDSFTWNAGPQPVLMAWVPHFSIASYPSQNLPSSSGRHSGYLAKAHHLRQSRRFAAYSIHFQNTVKGHHIFHGTIRLNFTNDAVVRKESFLGTGTWWPKRRQEHELPWDHTIFVSVSRQWKNETGHPNLANISNPKFCQWLMPLCHPLGCIFNETHCTCVKTCVDSHVLRFFPSSIFKPPFNL